MNYNFLNINNNQTLNFQFNDYFEQTKDKTELIKREINEIFYFQKLIKKNNLLKKKDFFELEITILKDYIQTEQDISILIIIPFNYPKSEPEIYCLTEFCHPHLCDGRNLLFDIIKDQWKSNIHNIEYIINKLPVFFVSFLEERKKKGNYITGSFILNKYYDMNRLKDLPIFFNLVIHKEKNINLYKIKSHKIITIGEISFCMFELDNNHTGYCKLIFFADLKDLIGIQLDTKNNEIEIKFKNIFGHIKIEIISSNSENINRILLENQKKFLSYNNNNNYIKNNIDINKRELSGEEKKIIMIEKQILYVEKSLTLGDKPHEVKLKYLLNLYKSAIEYYSSKYNQKKCDEYKSRINMIEPELNKLNKIQKEKNNKKKNILIDDDTTNIQKINYNGKTLSKMNYQNSVKEVKKEDGTKINNINNIFMNNDIFNFNNISNNSSNSNNNNNNIFNFNQNISQANTNKNNNNIFNFNQNISQTNTSTKNNLFD